MLQEKRNRDSRTPAGGRRWKYEPLPSAHTFHSLRARYKGFSGPIGSGKSYAFAYEALMKVIATEE